MRSIVKSSFRFSRRRDKQAGGFPMVVSRIREKNDFRESCLYENEAVRDGNEHPLGGKFRLFCFISSGSNGIRGRIHQCAVRTQTARL